MTGVLDVVREGAQVTEQDGEDRFDRRMGRAQQRERTGH
jgi:hypothetical protein